MAKAEAFVSYANEISVPHVSFTPALKSGVDSSTPGFVGWSRTKGVEESGTSGESSTLGVNIMDENGT